MSDGFGATSTHPAEHRGMAQSRRWAAVRGLGVRGLSSTRSRPSASAPWASH